MPADSVVVQVLIGAAAAVVIVVVATRLIRSARSMVRFVAMARARLSDEANARRKAEKRLMEREQEFTALIESRAADLARASRLLEKEIEERGRTMRDVEERIGFEELVERISAMLVHRPTAGANQSELPDVLEDVLGETSRFAGFDRASIVEFGPNRSRPSWVQWVGPTAQPPGQLPHDLGRERFRSCRDRLRKGEILFFDGWSVLDRAADCYRAGKPVAAVGLPLIVGGKLLGCLVMAWTAGLEDWDAKREVRLKLVAEFVAAAIHRSRVETDLAREAQNYSAIFHCANDAIMVFDLEDGAILDANEKMCAMWGIARDEMLEKKWMELAALDPEYPMKRAQDLMARAMAGEPQLVEWRTDAVAEQEALVEVSLRRIEIDGRASLLATMRDISDRKLAEQQRLKLERQLFQSQRMEALGTLAGGIAHDFNNILTVIIGNANLARDLVKETPGVDPLISSCLEEIEISGESAGSLTQQLLAFGRRQLVRPEVLDLGDSLAEMEGMLRRVIAEDIKLEINTDPATPRIVAAASQVQQVVLNLVVNARDAMPMGGVITVETFGRKLPAQDGPGHDEYAVLCVRDTGRGIEPDSLDHIFEPFFTTKPVGKGTGLGLATVHGIIKQLGGQIQVASEIGKGTAFEISFRASLVEAAAEAPQVRPPPAGAQGETILVCEDDDVVRALTCNVLRKGGYTVHAASRGAEAIEIARTIDGPIDALVTDVIMPEMNGNMLAKEICAQRPKTRVLFVSGYPADVLAPYGVMPDELEFLEKPFRGADLLRSVGALLETA